jgi:hypothetical protein
MPSKVAPKPIRLSTAILVIVLLVLGYALDVQERKEERLWAALALYKSQSHWNVERAVNQPATLKWPDGTKLSEAIEWIKQGTRQSPNLFARGIPLLVDPDGLREAGHSLSSPVMAPPGGDLSLQKKLRVILEPLGLACQVKDSALLITSRARLLEAGAHEEADGGQNEP